MQSKMKTLAAVFVLFTAVCCSQVEDYLEKYGYYNRNAFDKSDVKTAIKSFQQAYNLPVTGEVDAATKKLMDTPRCGNADHKSNRNAFADSRWSKKSLTYYFHNYSPDLSQSKIESITAAALKFWSDVTPLQFTKTIGRGDIVIGFGSNAHGDNKQSCPFPFDGPSGTLAHAYFPPDGRLHFDEAEFWTDGTPSGQNYLSTAVHEFGHILGLEHDTTTKDSIMYPYAMPYTPNLRLHSNDIRRIQSLYGTKTGGGGGGVLPPNCSDQNVDCYKYKLYCDNYSQAWTDYMKQYCRQTCNKC